MRVTAEKEKNPARVDRFHIEVEMPALLDDRHWAGVEDAVHRCLIHNTLQHPPQIQIEFKSSEIVTEASRI